MICIQKIYGFCGLNLQIIEESWDVTPVTNGRRTESGKYEPQFPFSIHFSLLKSFDRPTISTKLQDKLVNEWIIYKLYINNQLSIPDVFNWLSIDIQWNINYYWTIRVTDTKGKPLPRLSKHHQWTNLQLGVWSQRCSMLMHCPSVQVKSPSLFLF